MKKKNYLWSLLTTIMVCMLSVSLISCGGDDDDSPSGGGGTVNPGGTTDPAGTISLSMRNASSGTTTIDNVIYINKSDNFEGYYSNVCFASVGSIKGLGNVTSIPTSGWAKQVAVKPGYGYVAYYNGTFYRIYVEDFIEGTSGGVIGAEVKYQKPFKGKDEKIALDETSLSFPAGGGLQTLTFKNSSIIPFTATSSEDWCQVTTSSTNDVGIPDGIAIYVNPNSSSTEATITLKTLYDKETLIKVSIAQSISLSQEELTIGAGSSETNLQLFTNVPFANMTTSSTASWCKAQIVDVSEAMHAKAKRVKYIAGMPANEVTDNNTAKAYQLKLIVEKNESETSRQATVTVKSKDGKCSASVKVAQEGVIFKVPISEIGFDKNNNYRTVTIETNTDDWEAVSSASWCTFSKNGKELTIRATPSTEDRTATVSFKGKKATIKVHQSKYAAGDAYNENGLSGTVAYVGDGTRYIMHKFDTYVKWSTEEVSTGATDENDGRKNMAIIRKINNFEEVYPAFGLCESLNVKGETGWYLPAVNELLNISASLLGYNYIDYWSSTEQNKTYSYYVESYKHLQTDYISKSSDSKSKSKCVVAIHQF